MDKVRQALFSMLESRGAFGEEMRVLDLFAGSGSLGLEALSRGASEVWFVEHSQKAVRALRETLARLQVPKRQFRIVAGKVAPALRRPPDTPFDLVLVDPPYGHGLLMPVLEGLLDRAWLSGSGCIAAEVEAELTLDDLPGLTLEVNRTYGQTRIGVWKAQSRRPQSIPEPSTP
jgi:16S rRNA (guanine966-N2)-methyltransferase